MTLNELMEEADRQGYRLVKKAPKTMLLPCICGCNKRQRVYKYVSSKRIVILECMRCGKRVEGINEMNARVNWNKEITRIMNEEFARGEKK